MLQTSRLLLRTLISTALVIAILWAGAALWIDGPESRLLAGFLAGTLVLTGTSLAYFMGQPAWLILPAFVGTNLLQSAITGFCPAEKAFKAMGAKSCTCE